MRAKEPPGCSSTRSEAASPRTDSARGKRGLALNADLPEAGSARNNSFGLRPMQTRRFGGFCYSGVLVFGLAGTEPCARAIPRAVQACAIIASSSTRQAVTLAQRDVPT